MSEDINFPTDNGDDQRTLKEYLSEHNEQALKLLRTKFYKPEDFRDMFEQIKRASKAVERIQPFMDLIFREYPESAWFMVQPLQIVTFPVQTYMSGNGLEDGSSVETHKGPFLEFFREYITALERIRLEQGEAFDLDAAQREILNLPGPIKSLELTDQEIIRTIYPTMAVSLIDKVSKTAFAGELTEQLQPLKAERRGSLKKIDTFASINFSAPELKDLKGLNLTHYEKAVMDAIINLYIVGNEYMTLQMIYQRMRGDGAARLSPGQSKELSDCITKFMYGGIKIDATQEAKAYKLPGSLIYDTNLLHIERVMHNLNGTITECIHLIRTPVLYEYASSKGQIGRVPMLAIATPLDKNKETFSIQSYLLERVLGMRGGDLQHKIAYSTIYSIVWGQEAASKGTQSSYIRVKRSRLKKKIFTILDHWTHQGTYKDGGALIKGYEEYPEGKTAQGITIIL